MEGAVSLPVLFFSWWYSIAYRRVFRYVRAIYIHTYDLFSVKIIFVTLFAPWKRDQISYEGLSLQQKFEVWTLNLASRFVGFAIKIITLSIFIGFVILETALSIVFIIAWPFYPLVLALLIYFGVRLAI